MNGTAVNSTRHEPTPEVSWCYGKPQRRDDHREKPMSVALRSSRLCDLHRHQIGCDSAALSSIGWERGRQPDK